MSIYLIAFISAVVLYVALIVTTCYMEYCLGKRYELMRGVSEILECAVFLTFGWWFLERFSSGFDSGFGWWLFAFALGLAISLCIRIATNRICERIWFKGERAEITTVKVQKGLKIAIHLLTLILEVGFAIFLVYCLVADKLDGIGEIILSVLIIALFLFGTYDNIKVIIRQCKK